MNCNWKNAIWFVLISTLISACGSVAAAAPATGTAPCKLESNPYIITPINQNLINIYENGVVFVGDANAYNTIRQQGFNELVNHVYSLSDSVDIQSGDKTFRITITYISPELIHIIIVNHYLYKRYTTFSGKLNEQVTNHISRIVGRDEHIFFMTIMASLDENNTANNITLPLKQLELINTHNAKTTPEHDDHILENPINLRNSSEYGFFYYPMAVIRNGTCQAVLDKNYDTRFVLSIPNIVINDTDTGPQSWRYEYAPLIDMSTMSGVHQNKFVVNLLIDQFSPKKSTLTTVDLESMDYWIALSRLIWLETTMDP